MENDADIRQYWMAIKRRKFQIIIPAVLVFSLSVIIAFILPPIYKSTGTILIEAQEIPPDLVQSTVTGYVEERLHAITRLVLSRTRLLEIINRFDLYDDLKGRYATEEIIQKMREGIVMEPIQARDGPRSGTIAFTLSYEGKDPRKVAQAADALASAYLEENLKRREEKARGTVEFLEKRLSELRLEIQRTEEQIAEFKDKHMSQLPELIQLNLQTMERLEREIDASEEQIKTLVNRRIYLHGQLATVEPMIHSVSVDGTRAMTPRAELATLRTQYLRLSATLSEEHPDVIAIKKRLDFMETEVTTRDDLRERYRQLEEKETRLAPLAEKLSLKHPDVIKLQKEVARLKTEVEALSEKQSVLVAEKEKPDNPLYINLQTQIASTQMEIDAARRHLKFLKGKYEDYQTRVESTPQVEQQYRALQRDYTNAQTKYQETMDRLLTAREARELEVSRMAERFTLVDPPAVPEKPYRPNRLAILLMGLVLAAGAGGGLGYMAEYMDQSVRRPDEMARVTGKTVLAVIPYLETTRDRARKRLKRWIFVVSTAAVIIMGLAALNFLYKPLDILWSQIWSQIMRRLHLNL